MRGHATLPSAVLLLTALAVCAGPVRAQTPFPGTCDLGRAQTDLDVSEVSARLFNTGSLFFGNGTQAGYLVPRLTGRSPVFAAGIWVSGVVGGVLRVAGATYADFEFWPGPLDPATAQPPDPTDCAPYDRIWNVSARDVQVYEAGGGAAPDLADWPVALGAEVVDGDGVPGNYNLAAGDRPRIYGTQTAFWVMNDVGNVHRNSLLDPLGLEVRVHAFSILGADETLRRTTVYRYTLVNRTGSTVNDAIFSVFADTDLGDPADDYVGVDTARGLGFVYNGDNQDGSGDGGTYGTGPPAAGFDLLDADLGSFIYFIGGASPPMTDPNDGQQIRFAQEGRWSSGDPLTVGGTGYNPGSSDTTRFAFPGDPVPPLFWSQRCPVLPCGQPGQVQDHRLVLSTRRFALAPGEQRGIDVAIVFGQGADHVQSVASVREASDNVQAAFDSGTLFQTTAPPDALPPPVLVAPSDGQYTQGSTTLIWEAVAGAEGYQVQVWPEEDPAAGRVTSTQSTSAVGPTCGPDNRLTTCVWRVRADAPTAGLLGTWSAERRYVTHTYAAGLVDGGGSVIETANPTAAPCPDPGDFGCETYAGEGNSVFLDRNRTADYDITSTTGIPWGLFNAVTAGAGFTRTASPYDYEIRFTEAGGYAVYNAFLGPAAPKAIVRVPFEVWNVGTTPEDPSDDVRMIPVLRQNVSANPLVTDWSNTFTSIEIRTIDGEPTVVALTEQLAALFPDRPNGYDLFEAAAIAFGGAGATYIPTGDGDTQIDLNPSTGEPCSRQGYYIGFCARNDQFVPPGNNTLFSAAFVQLLFADIAGDGTTPPAGTAVRLKMARYPLVANDPPPPAGRERVTMEPVRPNPVTGAATVAYSLAAARAARVVVYDVLGREVAVLADGPAPAGRREASLDAGALAPGVYVVAVETSAGRDARTFTVSR